MMSLVRIRTAITPKGPAALAVGVALCLSVPTSDAAAQQRSNAQAEQSRSLMGQTGNRSLPPSGRYTAESGEGFIFDRSGARTLFRFERRSETWVLRPSPAPRGDIIYRNDEGARVLRVSADGGMTLYTVRAPNGTPAAMVGPAEGTLGATVLGPERLFQLMAARSGMLSQALGRVVEINLDGDRSEALCVDALMVTTEAVLRMARSATLRGRLADLRSITIVEGSAMSVRYRAGELRVVVDPDQDLAGRPSSGRIIRAFDAG